MTPPGNEPCPLWGQLSGPERGVGGCRSRAGITFQHWADPEGLRGHADAVGDWVCLEALKAPARGHPVLGGAHTPAEGSWLCLVRTRLNRLQLVTVQSRLGNCASCVWKSPSLHGRVTHLFSRSFGSFHLQKVYSFGSSAVGVSGSTPACPKPRQVLSAFPSGAMYFS